MDFWNTLQKLVDESEVEIDRAKESAHPRYPDYIYPFDYGYLAKTTSTDGGEIDCWVGSLGGKDVTGVIVIVDPEKRDSEIKILLGSTPKDMSTILKCHQRGAMEGLLIEKPQPS